MRKLNTKVMFSSATDEYSTPKDVFNKLNKEFNFDSDPCPIEPNTPYGLKQEKYGKRIFINPPYSKIELFTWRAYQEFLKGKLVVMLIPSRTDTKWWHNYVMKATEIRFIKGRLKFGNSKNPAPFPSCIVIFDGRLKEENSTEWINRARQLEIKIKELEDKLKEKNLLGKDSPKLRKNVIKEIIEIAIKQRVPDNPIGAIVVEHRELIDKWILIEELKSLLEDDKKWCKE